MKGWAVFIAICSLLGAPVYADDAEMKRRVEELERRQDQLTDELRRLQQKSEKPEQPEPKVEELERREKILTDEVRRLRESLVIPETTELKSVYGQGPAASKVYGIERGLSIGGYGETNFKKVVGNRGSANDEFD